MNKKIPLGIALAFTVFACAVSFAVSAGIMERAYNSVLAGLPEKLDRYEIVDEIDDVINANYYGKNDRENLEQAMAQGYVSALGEEENRYMSASLYQDYLSERNGNITGIGIKYKKAKNSRIEITYVDRYSPAYEAGLRKGDIIIAFDGIMLDAENYAEMTEKLTSDKLSSLNLIYKRGEVETTVNVRKGYEAKSVTTDVYENVGYIEITAFYPSTPSQVKEAVDKYTSSQLAAIVVDLRDNSSDNYDIAMETLDIFLPMTDSGKAAASVTDKNGKTVKTYTTTAGEVNIPVAVLISAETAQAAELFACNLRDFGKALIFSEASSGGSALVQEIFELSRGDALLLTTGTVLPYSGVSFDGVGLEPDYTLEKRNGASNISKDNQFLYAFSVMTE